MAAWLLIPNHDEGLTYEIASVLQERHKPVVVTRLGNTTDQPGQPYDDGATLIPDATPLPVASAIIGTLMSQARSIASLAHEAWLLRLHQTNVADHLGKLDEELRMAAKIQREFLPKSLPKIDPYRFDVLWRPAHYVSGDIYDISRLDEDHIGLFIADAVGHGVPAALMTIYIKQSLHTKEIHNNGYRLLEPTETLIHLNRRLLEQDAGSSCFATACYGILNIKTGNLRLARAGHPLPMLFKHEQPTQQIAPEGPMLGVFDTDEFEQLDIQLDMNDRFIMYSDGFEMAFPEEADEAADAKQSKKTRKIATDRYVSEFEVLRDSDLGSALAKIAHLLDAESGSLNQRDDLTMLCVSRKAMAAGMPMPQAAAA
jgi:sigma-B regulation protein RsbU (phosphoserine phosphatase)